MVKMVIAMRRDLGMRKGKMVAQGSHAALKFLVENMRHSYQMKTREAIIRLSNEEVEWLLRDGLSTKICVSVNSEQELLDLIQKARDAKITVHSVTDAGKTEFKGVPTLTCAAFGPAPSESLDKITGHLPLL